MSPLNFKYHNSNLVKMRRFFFLLTVFLLSIADSFAQKSEDVEMATGLRSSGKIYVVVTVISVIFIALAVYLFSLDRRVKKLENQD